MVKIDDEVGIITEAEDDNDDNTAITELLEGGQRRGKASSHIRL